MVSCKEYFEIKQNLLQMQQKKPILVIFQIDDNAASNAYIRGKKKDCEKIGIQVEHFKLKSEQLSQEDFETLIKQVGEIPSYTGILIQLPIPDKYDLESLIALIPKEKDVDGFKKDSPFYPCTAKGIIDWLNYNSINVQGKDVVVIGRSNIVGKPLVNMLIEQGATVTCCNSHTKDIQQYTKNAEIVISAVGKPYIWDASYFSDKTKLIIDVGISRVDGMLVGDVDSTNISDSTYVTPVPGGVGLLTRIALLENLYF